MYRLMPFTRRALAAAAALSSLAAAPRLASAQAACAAGESTIRAGDARLASFRPIAADSIDMTLEREGASRPFGVYTQHVERTTANGAAALLFVQRAQSPRGVMVDSIWVDARGWAPIRHVASTPGSHLDVAYRGGRVTGHEMRGDTMQSIDQPIPEGTFDYSVANAAVAALPLCEGAVIRVGGYDPAAGQIRDLTFHVLGGERVPIGGAPREVWTLDAQMAGRTVRIHVDRASGRELQWAVAGPGGGTLRGTSQIFDAP